MHFHTVPGENGVQGIIYFPSITLSKESLSHWEKLSGYLDPVVPVK